MPDVRGHTTDRPPDPRKGLCIKTRGKCFKSEYLVFETLCSYKSKTGEWNCHSTFKSTHFQTFKIILNTRANADCRQEWARVRLWEERRGQGVGPSVKRQYEGKPWVSHLPGWLTAILYFNRRSHYLPTLLNFECPLPLPPYQSLIKKRYLHGSVLPNVLLKCIVHFYPLLSYAACRAKNLPKIAQAPVTQAKSPLPACLKHIFLKYLRIFQCRR